MNRMLNMHKMRRVLNMAHTFGAQSLASLGIQSSVENADVEWGKLTKQRNLKDGLLVPWVSDAACMCFCLSVRYLVISECELIAWKA